MRTLILTTAALIAGLAMSQQATAADHGHHQPSISHGGSHGATLNLVGHRYSRPGHSLHGRYGHHGSHGYHGYRSYYPPRHGCARPAYVHPPIYHPPVVVPFPGHPPVVHPPVHHYRTHRYGHHQGGMSINTGRVGFSIAF
jgi:hypothetical protein